MKAKECARWHQRVVKNKVKLVKDLSAREQRAKRKQWREQWRKRAEKKQLVTITASVENVTPSSRQWRSGRKKVRRDRSAAYRKIQLLEAKLAKSVATNNALRKRLSRERKSSVPTGRHGNSDSTHATSEKSTPRKAAKVMMTSPRKTVRTLIYHYSVMSDLRARLKSCGNKERRLALSVLCAGKLLRKHRLLAAVRQDIGLRIRKANGRRRHKSSLVKLNRFRSAHSKRAAIEKFFERDDVSRATASKKNYNTA